MLHLLWSIIIGFVVGWIARAVLPGADTMGFLATAIVGIVGSLVGGLIGRMIRKPEPGAAFHPAGFLMSIVGAVVVLLLWRMLSH
ncbi:MAG TPA: GlsB/YeaQ/YmgE family stress response membrane protein [Thermoanaerobaculia bacterium]|nr:GlsB/YeaQ/YmgE family stress response membrane protein [Thermoanaerobaculia bacterium]